MNRREANNLLGIHSDKVSPDQVRQAFAVAVKRHHPDGRTMTVDMGGQKSMADLKAARDFLLSSCGEPRTEKVCPICRGSGVQSIGIRKYPCVRGCAEPA